jgi:hypothetical protein
MTSINPQPTSYPPAESAKGQIQPQKLPQTQPQSQPAKQPVAGCLPEELGAKPPGDFGLFGGMASLGMGLGFGPTAHRVEKGESLEKIAKQKLPPPQNNSPQDIQRWVQAAAKLNKLTSPNQLQAGQVILLPSILPKFETKGNATPSLSFLDDPEQIDVPQVIAAQKEAAAKLAEGLKTQDVSGKLAHYQTAPPPDPSPEDITWLFQLKAAENNNLLKYKPSAPEQQLAKALQEAIAWKQMLNQPTRISQADLDQLPAAAKTTLKAWMAADGNADNFSSLDLAKASPQAVKTLLQTLKQAGNPPHAQRLVQLMTQLSRSESLNIFGNSSFAFEKSQQPRPYMTRTFDPLKLPKADLEAFQANLKQIEKTLSDPSLIERGGWNLEIQGHNLRILEPSKNAFKDFDLSEGARKAEFARQELRVKYGFEPANPHDLNAIKAIKAKLKTPEDQVNFIGLYLNAHYEHPGKGTSWSALAHLSERLGMSEKVFFGNPPPLDRLPDGRALIDCEGFTKLSQILLDTLAPGNLSLPIRQPGHVFNLAKVGDRVYAFNNQHVQAVEMSPPELQKFSALQDDYSSQWTALNPFKQSPRMTAANFPGLYKYTELFEPPTDPHLAKLQKGNYLSVRNRDDVFEDLKLF